MLRAWVCLPPRRHGRACPVHPHLSATADGPGCPGRSPGMTTESRLAKPMHQPLASLARRAAGIRGTVANFSVGRCRSGARAFVFIVSETEIRHEDLLDQGPGAAPRAGAGQASRRAGRVHRHQPWPEDAGLRRAQSQHEGAGAGGWRDRAVGVHRHHGASLRPRELRHVASAPSAGAGRGAALAGLDRQSLESGGRAVLFRAHRAEEFRARGAEPRCADRQGRRPQDLRICARRASALAQPRRLRPADHRRFRRGVDGD